MLAAGFADYLLLYDIVRHELNRGQLVSWSSKPKGRDILKEAMQLFMGSAQMETNFDFGVWILQGVSDTTRNQRGDTDIE